VITVLVHTVLVHYFCDAHSPWQKGTVENTIGRLRRDMPRKTAKQDYSNTDFDDIVFMHNNTPRRYLSFKTPAEAFLKELNRVALGL
jgi:transposase, IS30 family